MRSIIIPFLILFIAFNSFAQETVEQDPFRKKYSIEQLKEDFKIFREELEANHTGLYEYTSKQTFDQVLNSYENSLVEPMTDVAFWRLLSKFLPTIGNGHTNIRLSESSQNYLIDNHSFLPLGVTWLEDKLYVIRNNSEDTTIEVGSQILKINSKPVQKIVDNIVSHKTRDGKNLTFPTGSAIRSFGFNFLLLERNAKRYRLELIDPKGDKRNVTLKALPIKEIHKLRAQRYEIPKRWWETTDPKLSFQKVPNEPTAILKIQTFSKGFIKKGGQKYKRFLKNTFQQIKEQKIQNLILDLRGNGGGDDGLGNLLYSYMAKEDFNYYKAILSNNRKIENPKRYEQKGLIRLMNFARIFIEKKQDDGMYRQRNNPGLGTFSPQKETFDGNLYVLIDGGSFSATGEIASCIHYHKRGVFIGEEVGGNYYKNTSGAMLPLVLPNTKIRVSVPIFQYIMDYSGYPEGQGVKPDFPVSPTIQQVLDGEDAVLNFALEKTRGN